jgi:2-octaprenyl-6-methoxyphenol hydroxylase
MNVCIIGDGLTSLSLAKNLVNKKINVQIYQKKKTNNPLSNRTIGITKKNLEFFNKEILRLPKKNIWEIKKIEIYSEKIKKNQILNFEQNKNNLFYMIKNNEIYKLLNDKLLKSKFFKKKLIKDNNFYKKLLKIKKYDLIINCESQNYLSNKYFSNKIEKNYNNHAYTTILEHEKLENNTAIQVFTKAGPIAFLPISNVKTSVVCSLELKNIKYSDSEIYELINKNNPNYKIKKISKLSNFKLKSSNLRNYYHKNVLAFGDLLHKIHPLAGQGFNMTIRDINILSEIIQSKINLGIQLDASVLEEFEKKTKHINFIFASGIDFIYEFFSFNKKIKDQSLNKILQFIGKNKFITNTFIKIADEGVIIK